jgi:hypothetical protein
MKIVHSRMYFSGFAMQAAIILWICIPFCSAAEFSSLEKLHQSFQNPPADSRIMMRWWWFGPAVEKSELEGELRAMKQGGIGGVELQVTYPLALDDPEQGFENVPFLSDSFLDSVRFASDKARELGLRFDVTLGSGWPYGGPHIPINHAAGKLRFVSVAIAGNATSVALPDMETGEKLLTVFLEPGDSGTFQPEKLLRVPATEIQNGRVRLPAQSTNKIHSVLFFISSRTGMMVKRPALGAEGFVLDHFDLQAAELHLHDVGERLLSAFGDHPPTAIFSDSLEVYESDWTPDLLKEFQQRRGYDLTPYLPALIMDIGPKTADIRHDWGKTLTELVQKNYLTPIHNWAQQHHTLFRSQTYGIPAVSLSSNSLVDLPEGEGEQWRQFTPTRWASSASHIYGVPVTSAETWTWLHSPVFRATPLDMKSAADLYFLQGANQLIGHGWPYSPPEASEPGWSFYAAAVFNDHNPWWLVMPEVTRYLQRVSFVLRQGTPANDVAIMLPTDDAWSQFTAGHDSLSEAMSGLLGPTLLPQIMDAGFNVDFVDANAINKLGIHHSVLILPGLERIPLSTYRMIEDYSRKGGIVIATRRKPSLAPGLQQTITDTPPVREISQELFEGLDHAGHFVSDENTLGMSIAAYLKPDILMSPPAPEIGAVHRKLPMADIYFLANTSNKIIETKAIFRTTRKYAEWFDPISGEFSNFDTVPSTIVYLRPYESRVVVLSEEKLPRRRSAAIHSSRVLPPPIDLSTDWDVSFAAPFPAQHMHELRSWAVDEATKYYSGTASYQKSISIPSSLLVPNIRLYLNFGNGTPVEAAGQKTPRTRAWIESPVHEGAQIFVNGAVAGAIWHPPYEVDITKLLHVGQNNLKIVVGNLAINTLAGRAPADYHLLNSRYGQRFIPQDKQNLQPLPSGLLGPIRIIPRDQRIVFHTH